MKPKLVSTVIAAACRTHAAVFSIAAHRPSALRCRTQLIALIAALFVVGFVGLGEATAQDVSVAGKVLIFRNIPSWNRSPDFEDASRTLGLSFDVKKSSEMKTIKMSDYRLIVIPGAQWETGYYADFARASQAFDHYVQAGGTLLFELNGAENEGITLPGGPSMVAHEGTDNVIVMPRHPAVAPLAQKPRITANLASHGYLEKIPPGALVLATVMADSKGAPDQSKPTYIEYPLGKGRIIAACQCFHDQDESGRGPLMPAALTYALAGKWYAGK